MSDLRSTDVEKIIRQVRPPRLIWMLRLLRRWVPPASRQERAFRWFGHNLKRLLQRVSHAWPGYADKQYERWRTENEPDAYAMTRQAQELNSTAAAPSLSVILLPSMDGSFAIKTSVLSIQFQTYQRWELCILLEEVDETTVKWVSESVSLEDTRICLKRFDPTKAFFFDLLGEVKGNYVILFPRGDMLAPHALCEIVYALSRETHVDVLYTDQDRFNVVKQRREQPWFKPDWSPELLLSINYLTPLIVRKRILDEVVAEGWQLKDDTSLWDLAFRCVEKARAIVHLPMILYHKNAQRKEQSAAEVVNGDAVVSHLKRIGIPDAEVHHRSKECIQAFWPTRRAPVSVIIPTKDHPELLRRCLDGVLTQTDYPRIQVIIVDNGSVNPETSEYYTQIQSDERVKIVLYDEVFNYSRANNLGVQHTDGEHLLFLNDDVEILEDGWLEEMVRWSERDGIGAVGARLLFPIGTIQHAGIIVGLGGHAGHVFRGAGEDATGLFGSVEWYRNYLAVTGACLMVPRNVFHEIGRFNEAYLLAFGDVDLCLRIVDRGYRVLYTPFARLIHHESASRGRHIPTGDLLKGYYGLRQWLLEGDPYFNPNLSYANRIPSLRLGLEDRLEALEMILARRLAVEGYGETSDAG